ncbi:hypothetical protein C1H46_008576 [Malus baccata]|uniref:Uncharacterized protein n=1 Tax=Malus baccata TaxID=106549 RepID=A0A540N5R2_MALBA|nr:hypothetical protein C1H46_008576 [Malus baccata]
MRLKGGSWNALIQFAVALMVASASLCLVDPNDRASDGEFILLRLWNASDYFIFGFEGGNFPLFRSWNASDLFIFGFEGGAFSFIPHTAFAASTSTVIHLMAPMSLA